MPPTQRSASSFSCMQSYRSVLLAGGGGRRVGGGGEGEVPDETRWNTNTNMNTNSLDAAQTATTQTNCNTDGQQTTVVDIAVNNVTLHNAWDASCKSILQFNCANCQFEQVSPSPLASWCVVFIVASVFVESTVCSNCMFRVLKPSTSNITFSSSRGSCVVPS